MTSKHVKLAKYKNHRDQDGCVVKHEPDFDKPSFPKCAYRPKGYQETLSGTAKGATPASSKKALYELDFTVSHPKGTPIEVDHQRRLPKQMEPFKATGRPTNRDKLLGIPKAIYRATDPRTSKTAWHFVGNNYKVWNKPFGHEYHHIMPEEALSEKLTFTEARLLQSAGYNINNGKNLIILPITLDVAFALMLPRHKGWHRAYNIECGKMINSIKRDVAVAKGGPHEITESNKSSIKDQIETWEDNQYGKIVNFGRQTVMKSKGTPVLNQMFST